MVFLARMSELAEAELYHPIKQFLEGQGYAVKGEIGACDVVGVRDDQVGEAATESDMVVVELKERLTLALLLQAVDRLRVSSAVYVAFRTGKGQSATWRSRRKQVVALARRLGIGILTVSARGRVEPVLDPGPYKPRADVRGRGRLLKEFAERVGDPETGGSSTQKRLTAYRQDALRCAGLLNREAVLKASVVRDLTGVERAASIMRDNHYGWFERVKLGHYELSPKGRAEIEHWAGALQSLEQHAE